MHETGQSSTCPNSSQISEKRVPQSDSLLVQNLTLADALARAAAERAVTPAQLAIAWVLARGTDIIPLVGARTRERLAESLGALSVRLTPEDLARIEAAVPANAVAGERYSAAQMLHLDSERHAATS